jgi:hypothetical protein
MRAEVQAKRFPVTSLALLHDSKVNLHFLLFTFHSSFFVLHSSDGDLAAAETVEDTRFFFSLHFCFHSHFHFHRNLVIAKITLEAEVERPIIIPSTKPPKISASCFPSLTKILL